MMVVGQEMCMIMPNSSDLLLIRHYPIHTNITQGANEEDFQKMDLSLLILTYPILQCMCTVWSSHHHRIALHRTH